jgi:hypothetical protein
LLPGDNFFKVEVENSEHLHSIAEHVVSNHNICNILIL